MNLNEQAIDLVNQLFEAPSLSKEDFDKEIATGQELQKRNPPGSELHRKGFEIVRKAVIDFTGQDKVGNYEDF